MGNWTRHLSGAEWEVKGFLGDDWIGRRSEQPETRDRLGWLPARVPGSVHDDLFRAGEAVDPYFERNSLGLEWIPERTWIYRRRFRLEASERRDRVALRFEGLDYSGRIFLNGEELGAHAGTFVPAAFDVGERLRWGEENHVAVVLDPAPENEPQVGRSAKVRVHKPRMNYGWDFCPRMIHVGIWDDVTLRATGAARLEDVWARPILANDLRRAEVRVRVRVSCEAGRELALHATIAHAGREVARGTARATSVTGGETELEIALALDAPALWWPNGLGDQALYTLDARLEVDGDLSDARTLSFGVRHVELVPNETPDATARPYTFVVNGRRTYANGWNWCPIDPLYGVPRPAKLARLIELARRANVNLLRVWGGGLIETERFYDACDRAGIMVWQEFSLSSSGVESDPPRDGALVEHMVREAHAIVPRRRNHPSLVLWCGGNELQTPDGKPLDDSHPLLGALASVVRALDPDRLWLPTSPTGRAFMNRLDDIERDPLGQHDVHGPWEHQGPAAHYALYDRGTALLSSEHGVEGMTNRRAYEALVSPARRWPAGRDNPVMAHLGSWWNNAAQLDAWLGGIADLDAMRRISQFMQADGLRYAVEANRRRKWRSSGTIPWQMNESYPNAWCTASIDWWAHPKPAYFAVARAYAPTIVCAALGRQALAAAGKIAAQIWIVTGAGIEDAVVRARALDTAGSACDEWSARVAVAENASTFAGDAELDVSRSRDDCVVLDLEVTDSRAGTVVARNRYVLSRTEDLAPLAKLAQTTLEVQRAGDGALVVRNAGETLAHFVEVEDARPLDEPGWAWIADSGFSLLPGEERVVPVSWEGVDAAARALSVSAWNADLVRVR